MISIKSMRVIISFIFIYTMLVLNSCSKRNVDVYSPDEVGKIMQIKEGTLINSRLVLISGLDADNQNWGSIIGAVVVELQLAVLLKVTIH